VDAAQVSQDVLDREPLQDGRDDLQASWGADGHERLLMAGTTHSRPRQEADRQLIAGSLPRSGYGNSIVEPDPAIS
jgi:hypothetical protein